MNDNPAYETVSSMEGYAEDFEYPNEEGTGRPESLPASCPGAIHCELISDALRTIFTAIIEAADGNPMRMSVGLLRMSQLSYRDIGIMLHISQEAAHKHVRNMCSRNPGLKTALKCSSRGRRSAAVVDSELFDIKRKAIERIKQI